MANKDADTPAKKKSSDTPAESFKLKPAQIKQFAGEVKSEFGKIAWPEKKHTIGSTVVVLVLVMLMSIYLGAVDLLLGTIISSLLG